MSNQKRQPSGVPVGGQFDSNSHDEAGGALAAVDHDTLMEIGETRELPVTDIEFGETTVTRDEDEGIEHVSAIVPLSQWGHERNYDSDEDRVQFLAHYDGVSGSATRVEPTDREDGWDHYEYEVTLRNPYTDETITETWGTGSSETHERTPRAADVLHSMVSDASSVRGRSFDEWCDEMGYGDEEPESDEDYDAYYEGNFDPKAKHRKTYDACVEIDTKLQSFLGRRYDDYMWGNDDSSSLRVTFEKE